MGKEFEEHVNQRKEAIRQSAFRGTGRRSLRETLREFLRNEE